MPKKKALKKVAISYTDEDRRKIVEIWRKSGLTQRQFCKGLNLHPCTLSEWSSRFRKSQRDKVKKAAFVPVIAKPVTGALVPTSRGPGQQEYLHSRCGSLRVQVAGRFVVEVPETFSISTLRDLIVTLEAI